MENKDTRVEKMEKKKTHFDCSFLCFQTDRGFDLFLHEGQSTSWTSYLVTFSCSFV